MNWPSFTGGGQKFQIRLQGGTERKDAQITLTEPYFLDRPLAVSGTVYYHEENFLSSVYDQRVYGFQIEARKPLAAFPM